MSDTVRWEYMGYDSSTKLAEWGLSIETFRRAAQLGFAERANCTEFDPITSAGTEAWRHPTRYLRESLFNKGWRLDDPKNLPLIISDEHRINITVSSGDETTGLVLGSKQPKTKNPKGSILEAAVRRNVNQLALFPEIEAENVRKFPKTATYPTWVFLLFITDDEIRAELSLPSEMDGSDHIVDWAERIIISVMPPDTIGEDEQPDHGPDITPDIKLKV